MVKGMKRQWNSCINLCHVQWSGEGSQAKECVPSRCWRTQKLLRQNGHSCARWGPCSMECLKQSQLQQEVGCHIQAQSVPFPKMKFSLFLRSCTQAVACQFAQVGSNHIDAVATLPISKSNTNWMCPWPQLPCSLWTCLTIVETMGRLVTITEPTSQASLVQCWTNRKRDHLLTQLTEAALQQSTKQLLWLLAASGFTRLQNKRPLSVNQSIVREYMCRK